jgi:hypothetical protein
LPVKVTRQSRIQHYYDELNNLLKNEKWEEADRLTSKLMVYIAQREKENYLDINSINNFSCTDLKEIDRHWVANSNKRFGFNAQKEIWIRNNKQDDFFQFAREVGWYDGNGQRLTYEDLMKSIKSDKKNYQGSLPTVSFEGITRPSGNGLWEEQKSFFFKLLSRYSSC